MLKMELTLQNRLAGLMRLRRGRPGVAVGSRSPEGITLLVMLPAPAALKDVVESMGVPHCEIGAVSGDLDGLDELVFDGCRTHLAPAAPAALIDPRFLCDGHLGRLARLLRLLGFDTLWNTRWPEAEIARRGVNEGRTVLSGNLALLKRKELTRAMLVRADDPVEQTRQVVARFLLAGRARLMGRCSTCNGEIRPVAKVDVLERIPPKTAAWLNEYFICAGCGKLYWEGTHLQGLEDMLNRILRS